MGAEMVAVVYPGIKGSYTPPVCPGWVSARARAAGVDMGDVMDVGERRGRLEEWASSHATMEDAMYVCRWVCTASVEDGGEAVQSTAGEGFVRGAAGRGRALYFRYISFRRP